MAVKRNIAWSGTVDPYELDVNVCFESFFVSHFPSLYSLSASLIFSRLLGGGAVPPPGADGIGCPLGSVSASSSNNGQARYKRRLRMKATKCSAEMSTSTFSHGVHSRSFRKRR